MTPIFFLSRLQRVQTVSVSCSKPLRFSRCVKVSVIASVFRRFISSISFVNERIMALPVLMEVRKQKEAELLEESSSSRESDAQKPEDILFTQFLLDWLEMMKTSVEITTFAAYSMPLNGYANWNLLFSAQFQLKKSTLSFRGRVDF